MYDRTHEKRPGPLTGVHGIPFALMLCVLAMGWSAALISNFDFRLFAPEKFSMVYNDMAYRLLRNDMTIDPAVITYEAFIRAGRTYTYFGVFPALLRIPAILAGAGHYPLARLSCLAALSIVSFASVRIIQLAFASASTRIPIATAIAVLVSASFGGPSIYVLASASVWHEIIAWAAAGSMIFNWIVARRVFQGQGLRPCDFNMLAATAGCVLLTRVTCGAPLYIALGLLMGWQFVTALLENGTGRPLRTSAIHFRTIGLSCLIAILFVGAEAYVNYGRWGNPFTPVPMQYYGSFINDTTGRLGRFAQHGGIDLARIPAAMLYYAVGLKLEDVFPTVVREHFDGIEGPRFLGLLCAPLIIVCAATGLVKLCSAGDRRSLLMPLGLANVAAFLMAMSVPWLCLRYTFDGWACFVFFAAVGLRRSLKLAPSYGFRIFAVCATVVGVSMSHATLLRYKLNNYGTDPSARYWLSQQLQPLVCPNAKLVPEGTPIGSAPLVTPSCPPLW